jgi:hypothetical protein
MVRPGTAICDTPACELLLMTTPPLVFDHAFDSRSAGLPAEAVQHPPPKA